MANKIVEWMSKNLNLWVIIAFHGAGAMAAFPASVLYFMAGDDTAGNFWAMVTCLWIMTGIMRLIEAGRARK